MEAQVFEQNGRKYKGYYSPDIPVGAYIIIGPPEGLVDVLGLPEPFATRLHNILFDRGILTAKDASSKHREITGALQEALGVDVQKLVEFYFNLNQETV
jgi:hypothetical protein